ncbi:MAG: thioredoxin domain-containing protein, partial [Gammaproteobacteria bacterium]|nr:thioredoxin domain-containing protein [Gammaproteobacteria bacterium]
MRSLIVIELFRRPASTKGIFFGLLFALLLTLPAQAVNRLAAADSPYLRQHADNPVDWYPWGDEAFAKARSENKPVFLSIGYSSCCYWCRVAPWIPVDRVVGVLAQIRTIGRSETIDCLCG